MNRLALRLVLPAALAALCGQSAFAGKKTDSPSTCQLDNRTGKIKHVVYIEFDNVHFTRDNPNVPSDLEQMPNLLNFIKNNGTLDAGDHTVLVSHTANDILTTQTGLYSDNTGIFIANSFGVFGPSPTNINFPSSFFYWTDLVSDITPATGDNIPALTTPAGKNVPAPWAVFTRAGCDVGAFSTANIVLERTPFDVKKVFGPTSSQAMESTSSSVFPNQTDDFIGAAIHCAVGSPFCGTPAAPLNNAVTDALPDEPGGYTGYQALFGMKYVAPALGGITDYNGVPLKGFQALNFDPTAAQTLAVVETMLKKGIPVVFAYIADAHDNEEGLSLSSQHTFGPGQAPYVQQLHDYDAAFGRFFADLKAAGMDESNTLFIVTPDEGDHFVGASPTPANCDGAKIVNGNVIPDVPCNYPAGGIGEIDLGLTAVVKAAGNNTPFSIHFDDAATTYVPGQPGPSDPTVRGLEKTMAGLSAVNPQTGLSESLLGTGLGPALQGAIVDPVAQKLLHMNTVADPNREPTFTFFANPNFFLEGTTPTVPTIAANTFSTGSGFAWNHGDIQPEIGRNFIGMVGPGVSNLGITDPSDFFTDNVDLRPTMMYLLGLTDDYQHDGRVILEMVDPNVLDRNLHAHSAALREIGQIYKQINAPFGSLSESTLTVSTYAIVSDSAGDVTYTNLENKIAAWTAERDGLTAQIKTMLEGAEFGGESINEQQAKHIISQAQTLLDSASACAANPGVCAE